MALIKMRNFKILSAKAGKVGFRKANDRCVLHRCFGYGLLDLIQAVVNGGGYAKRCQCDDHQIIQLS